MEEFPLRNEGFILPMDFDDVFGGPPKRFFFRQRDRPQARERRIQLYAEIFSDETKKDDVVVRPLASTVLPPAPDYGRSLPLFRIPGGRCRGRRPPDNGFYDDVFGLLEPRYSSGWRSKSTKVRSSTLPPASTADDVVPNAVPPKLNKPTVVVPSPKPADSSCSERQNTHGNWTEASVGSSYNMEFADPSKECHKHDPSSSSSNPSGRHSNQRTQSMKTTHHKSYYNPEINSTNSVTKSTEDDSEPFPQLPEKPFRDDKFSSDFAGDFMIPMVTEQVAEDRHAVGVMNDRIEWDDEKMTERRYSFSFGSKGKPRGKKHELHPVAGEEDVMQEIMLKREAVSSCSRQPICTDLYAEDYGRRRSYEDPSWKRVLDHGGIAPRRSHEQEMLRKQMPKKSTNRNLKSVLARYRNKIR